MENGNGSSSFPRSTSLRTTISTPIVWVGPPLTNITNYYEAHIIIRHSTRAMSGNGVSAAARIEEVGRSSMNLADTVRANLPEAARHWLYLRVPNAVETLKGKGSRPLTAIPNVSCLTLSIDVHI